MNIREIKTLARQSYSAGQRQAQLVQTQPSAASDAHHRFVKSVSELSKTAIPTNLWPIAEKISDVPAVDDAIRTLIDATTDNATILVQTIITAYLKG